MLEFNTFSITARDPESGALGVGVSTCLPAVGAMCPWVRPGAGAISTQSFVNPYLGIDGLRLLEQGLSAEEALQKLLAEDPYAQIRQVAVVDTQGRATAFSGDECTHWYGHIVGDGYAIAGNMLVGEAVLKEMERAYLESAGQPLAERLLRALEAGQAAGGDRRGKQSAALYVATTEEYGYVDLRVDEHPDPVAELRRVYEVAQRELLPFIDSLATRANPGGSLDPEAAAAYRAQVEEQHPIGE